MFDCCQVRRRICIVLLVLSSMCHASSLLHVHTKQLNDQHCVLSLWPVHDQNLHRFYLKHPRRLVIDVPNTVMTPPSSLRVMCGMTIRMAHHLHGQRIVLDLGSKRDVHVHHNTQYHKVNLDITSHIQSKPSINIVIDAGHGGHDPGASSHGIKEKTIVLAIARKLRDALSAYASTHVHMTRDHDRYLTLRQRLAVARHSKADLFVAIHADAHYNHQAHGVSVYAVSDRGATNEAARWLARKENLSELLGGASLHDQSTSIQSVILSLQQQSTIDHSLRIGRAILHRLSHVAHLHQKHVEQAGFVVLKSPDIPSLLIETGFVSHQQERLLLRRESYQSQMARAIAQGIASTLHLHKKIIPQKQRHDVHKKIVKSVAHHTPKARHPRHRSVSKSHHNARSAPKHHTVSPHKGPTPHHLKSGPATHVSRKKHTLHST